MPQIRRGLGTLLRVWVVVRLEGRSAVGRNRQWKEKPEEKYEKEEERRQEGWEGGKKKLQVRRKVKKNLWYFTLIGTC